MDIKRYEVRPEPFNRYAVWEIKTFDDSRPPRELQLETFRSQADAENMKQQLEQSED